MSLDFLLDPCEFTPSFHNIQYHQESSVLFMCPDFCGTEKLPDAKSLFLYLPTIPLSEVTYIVFCIFFFFRVEPSIYLDLH
jgi:hypothetical protein